VTEKRNSTYPVNSARGFTIVEIIMTFIIIGILTLILTPVISNRANDARLTAAAKDLEHLKDALERAHIDTGYIVRMYTLNDTGGAGDNIAATDPLDRLESLSDNTQTTNNIYDNPSSIFINASSQDFVAASSQAQILTLVETNFLWHGPYIADWRRDVNNNDWPDDPWGNDYLFFSARGVLSPPIQPGAGGTLGQDFSESFEVDGPNPNNISTINTEALVFDRFVILSTGPNGLPGDGTNVLPASGGQGQYGLADDLVREFGGVVQRTNFVGSGVP
jgi:type II secretory pathway pseudopilin PulG